MRLLGWYVGCFMFGWFIVGPCMTGDLKGKGYRAGYVHGYVAALDSVRAVAASNVDTTAYINLAWPSSMHVLERDRPVPTYEYERPACCRRSQNDTLTDTP